MKVQGQARVGKRCVRACVRLRACVRVRVCLGAALEVRDLKDSERAVPDDRRRALDHLRVQLVRLRAAVEACVLNTPTSGREDGIVQRIESTA